MRFSTIALFSLVAIPASAIALNYYDQTDRYSDAPFTKAETAGISLLTDIGAISGNDDGTFVPRRNLNRAEFLKIALLSAKNVPVFSLSTSCFPDVQAEKWFARYVCYAKTKGMVQGYPDGKFHPENNVNYAEALKILGELYGVIGEVPGGTQEWYVKYREGAYAAGVGLPGMEGQMGTLLTRGQMARLAAAYRANSEGELAEYRDAERGKYQCTAVCPDGHTYQTCTEDGHPINYFADPCLGHDTSSSSTSSVSSLSSTSSLSSASSSSGPTAIFPATNHFLLVGATTPVLFDGTFTAQEEDGDLRFVTVRVRQEVKSLSGLILVDATGKTIGTLKLAGDDSTYKTWKGEYPANTFVLAKGVPVQLGVKATLKKDGLSSELFDTAEFFLQVQGVATGVSRQILPTATHYPYHQTAFARLQSVTNALSPTGTLFSGQKRQIASFAFSGAVMNNASLRLEGVNFAMQKSGVALSNFRIGGSAEIEQADCSVDSSDASMLSCSFIPETVRTVNGIRTLSVFANVTVLSGSTVPTLQLTLQTPGTVGVAGAVQWTDGAGHFNWMEGSTPLARGTAWTAVK